MRALPNEFANGTSIHVTCRSPMPRIGWGLFLLSLPVLVAYWLVLAPIMAGQALVAVIQR